MTINVPLAQEFGRIGLSNLAHAVRRSMALYGAIITSPEGTSDRDLLARADVLAGWLRGGAGAAEDAQVGQGETFLGKNPWE